MVCPSAFHSEGGGLDLSKVNEALKAYAEWLNDDVIPLKDNKNVDYGLLRYALNRSYNRNTCGFETPVDSDHPLANYMQSKDLNIGYDYWKDVTNKFFLEFPEAYKLTGLSLVDLRNMTLPEFNEVKALVQENSKIKEEYPDVETRQLAEFRELSRLIIEGLLNANLIADPRK